MAMDELINACDISSDKQISETLKRIEKDMHSLIKETDDTNLINTALINIDFGYKGKGYQ